ncbi:HAD family hydrolase [Methanoculleus sp. UBA303]|jgi:putative hydrolase of the HAD superfamily|uniref:HAD family hydrolase n=1 Tax=Methanoculleus sp. UBA303 TaxID=1915497 RepID=UPI0025EF47B5|nr:HAD family hydrolase [Methanoculleus sp. UBA303]
MISGPTGASPGGSSTRASGSPPGTCGRATSGGCRRQPTGPGSGTRRCGSRGSSPGICAEHSAWEIDAGQLGVEAARAFRAASLRRLGVIRKSQSLLDLFGTRKLGVVSNGQRVFSEQELRVLNLYDRLNFVIFSSDFGYQKPDPRIYTAALGRMNLLPENVLFIGDNHENDVTIPRRLGMQALHVEEAWRRYGT